ncbi:MAG: dienelactone hydrolase family protein [Geminicoccaceae bacterium]
MGFIIAAVVIGALAIGVGLNSTRGLFGLSVSQHRPEALSELLSPAYRITRPDGDGPFATALLFSGCDGPKDNLERLAGELKQAGWASVIVDSHAPRGYGDAEAWRLICAGQLLNGAERAADVAVALNDARAMPFVDAERIGLVGASHGGWAVLDFLAQYDADTRPPILRAWPDSLVDQGLDGVEAVALLYPYCGPTSVVAHNGWTSPVPALFLLVEGDTVTGERDCLRLAERMRARGLVAETELYPNVTHGFDQETKAPLSTLIYAPEEAARAHARIIAFLEAASAD